MTDIINFSQFKSLNKKRAVDEAEICERLLVSPSKLARMIKAKEFAAPMKFGYRMKRWMESDIDDYFEKMSAAR